MKYALFLTYLLVAIIGNSQTTWFVDASNTGTQNGQSWTTAFANLQLAIDTAAIGDTILVAAGSYYPTKIAGGATNPRDKAFILSSHVRIFGGFAGTETTLSERQSDSVSLHVTNKTTLSGDIGTLNDHTDNAYHVVFAAVGDYSSVLDGFEISGGFADSNSTQVINGYSVYRNVGAGAYTVVSHNQFKHCIFRDNTAQRGGAGVNNSSGGPYFDRCVFTENTVTGTFSQDQNGGGAGMRNDGSDAQISNSYFVANENSTNQGGGAIRNENSSASAFTNVVIKLNQTSDGDGGGGMYNATGSHPTLTNVHFISNSTTNQGGAMYSDSSVPHISNCEFLSNHADGGAGAMENDGGSNAEISNTSFIGNSAGANGGAIQNWQSSPVLESVLFEGNTATGDGGGIYNYNNCSPTIANAIFKGNVAGGHGGGIYNRRNCNPWITNALLFDNEAGGYGGGIYTITSNSAPCSPIATNVTITENQAGISGGGAYDDGAGNSRIRNSILFNNTAPINADVDAPAAMAVTAVYYVIIGTDYYTFGNNAPTPFTNNVFIDPANHDFRLNYNSPALESGDSSVFNPSATPDLSTIVTDLQGNMRVMGDKIDLGAYETCDAFLIPSVAINVSPSDSVLTGTQVLFSSALTNAGNSPSFQWFKNGTAMSGANADTLLAIADVDFSHGDLIYLWIGSDAQCADPDTALSNLILMQVTEIDTDTIIIDTTTGIYSYSSNLSWTLFPNPISQGSNLNVSFDSNDDQVSVRITDVCGRLILSQNVRNDQGVILINTAKLEFGTYMCEVSTEANSVSCKKLIVTN